LKSRLHPKLRILLFVALANIVWMTAAWFTLERENWLWITSIALSINFLLLTYDQVLTFSKMKSEALRGQDPWGLLKTVHELARDFDHPEPKVYLLHQPCAQVFSYGRSRKNVRLLVTEGVLKLLSERELRAVLTFQMIAIDGSYGMLNYWLGAVVDLLFRASLGLERVFRFIFGWSPRLSSWFVGPWAWLLHRLLMSPGDFQRLDKATAAKLETPEDLAQALWKMEAYAQTQPWADPWVFAHMCMVSPLEFQMFHVQPVLKSRIKNLLGRYPL
jgi:heat shock protein HtpX